MSSRQLFLSLYSPSSLVNSLRRIDRKECSEYGEGEKEGLFGCAALLKEFGDLGTHRILRER